MKNYLIYKKQDILDVDGNVLGKRVCDVSDVAFPVSDDYEWLQYAELFDIYSNEWYWSDKPVEYIRVFPQVIDEEEPATPGALPVTEIK